MIRVLHVINSFGHGGSETQFLRILRDYDRTSFHLDACTIGPNPGYRAEEARSLGAEVLSCPKSVDLASFSRRFSNLLGSRKYGVVHAHFDAWSGPLMRGAFQVGVPVRIAHLRSTGGQGLAAPRTLVGVLGREVVRRWGRRWIARYATHVLGVSRAALDARWPGWQKDSARFMVWSAGVDTQYFSPAGDGKKTDGPCLVICVSNFYLRSKRQDLVLRIFAELVKSVRQARLVFVGRGTYENHCKQLAEGLGIAGSVDFMGLRSRDQVLELLRTAKVFLSCSETEGLPNVLLEAQAVGVPVVASDIPAHREALAAELFPYLFKSDALHEAANSIKRIVLDPELRWSLARAGRQHVLNHYDGSRCLLTLENWYKLWTGAARQEHASD